MDFKYSPEQELFREEVRDWLAENMKELPEWWGNPDVMGPEIDSEERHQFDLWWHRKLYDAGFMGIAWPKEYGGRGATVMDTVVFNEEIARHRAPGPTNNIGLGWCGPTILFAGTEEQKKRFILPMLKADEIWCQGFSEPEAGSDMANSQTRAVKDGDYYVVNGQKVWTSGGHYSDWAILLARTDPSAPTKHRGLSYFLLDMHAPGVTVRPLVQITGHAEFNETFLDDVRIHKSLMVGEENRGWYIAMGTMEFERAGIAGSIRRENEFQDLVKMAQKIERNGQPLTKDPLIRQKLAQLYIETNAAKYIGLRHLTRQIRGERPGPEGNIGSALETELNQRMYEFAVHLQGLYGGLVRGSKHAIQYGRWQRSFLRSRGNTIETGTSEIKRNVIAQRVLGLPR